MKFGHVLFHIGIFMMLHGTSGCNKPGTYSIEASSYHSYPYNKLQRFFMQFFFSRLPSTDQYLELRTDSTFVFNTCGNIMTGTYKVRQDSLLLLWERNEMKSAGMVDLNKDSANMIVFFITHPNTLYREEHYVEKGKTYVLIDKLTKIE